MNETLNFQFGGGWQFDIGSFLIGVLAGILVAYGFYRVLPWLQRQYERIRGWVRQKLAWMRSGVEVRFKTETAAYAQGYHLGQGWATLDQIFVPPRLLAPPAEPSVPLEDRGAMQLNYLWPELAARVGAPVPPTMTVDQLLRNGRRVIISGETGSGKSTLLAHYAYRCATAEADGADATLLSTLPVLVHVAELELVAAEDTDVADPLARALQKRSNPLTSPGVKDLLQRRLKGGQVLLLLDGWDELTGEGRSEVADWLSALLAQFPQIRVFVSAGLAGYGFLLELDFTMTTLLPWRAGQAEALAAKWTKAFPLGQPPRLQTYWRPGQTALDSSLRLWLAAQKNGPDNNNRKWPKRQFTLLQTTLPFFVNRKRSIKDEMTPPDEDVLSFWQHLAYLMLNEASLAPNKIATVASSLATDEQGEVDKGLAGRWQKSIGQSTLFVTWSNNHVSFRNTLWRDFLAARHIVSQRLQNEVADQICHPQWHHVWRFYVTQAGATELAMQLLQTKDTSPARDTVFQIAAWMPEASDEGEWRRQAMILLGQMIRQNSFSPVLRQRAMAALVQTGEAGVIKFVTQLIERSDPFLRQVGTAALPALRDNKVIGWLAKMLADGDPMVRQTAVFGLAHLQHHPLTEKPIVTALLSDDEEVSRLMAEALAFNGERGAELLREALEDEDVQVRRSAILGLSLLDEAWVESELVKVERYDDEWFVRSAANEALETVRGRRKAVPWEPIKPGKQLWLADFALHEGRTVPDGRAAMPFLVQILSEGTMPKMRASAATLLRHLPALDAMPALETAVRDSEPLVSEAAFTTLCHLRRAYP